VLQDIEQLFSQLYAFLTRYWLSAETHHLFASKNEICNAFSILNEVFLFECTHETIVTLKMLWLLIVEQYQIRIPWASNAFVTRPMRLLIGNFTHEVVI